MLPNGHAPKIPSGSGAVLRQNRQRFVACLRKPVGIWRKFPGRRDLFEESAGIPANSRTLAISGSRESEGAMAGPKIRLMNTEHRLRSAVRHSLAVLLATTALGVVSAHAVDGTWVGIGDRMDRSRQLDLQSANCRTEPPPSPITASDNGQTSTGSSLDRRDPVHRRSRALAYTININDVFGINGTGVINNSTNHADLQRICALVFQNSSSASAGTGSVTYNNSGFITFQNASTAGTRHHRQQRQPGVQRHQHGGERDDHQQRHLNFQDASTAGSAGITNSATGIIAFSNTSTAGSRHHRQQRISSISSIRVQAGSANITNNLNGDADIQRHRDRGVRDHRQ